MVIMRSQSDANQGDRDLAVHMALMSSYFKRIQRLMQVKNA